MKKHQNILITFLFISLILIIKICSLQVDLSKEEERNGDFLKYFSNPSHRNLRTESEFDDYNEDLCLKRKFPLDGKIFYFFPQIKAKLYKVGDQVKFRSKCFLENTAILKELSKERAVIEITSKRQRKNICLEYFFVHTLNLNVVGTPREEGTNELIFNNLTQDDLDEIRMNSILILGFCQGMFETVRSVIKTLKAFIGGNGGDPESPYPIFRPSVPDYMLKENLEMLRIFNNYIPEMREDKVLELDESMIHSGDFMAIARYDGIDNIIMIASGSVFGHSVVCVWIDGELNVIESTEAGYFPGKHGIQRHKWREWIDKAHKADFNVALMPLKEEYRKKFNVEKALEFFYKMEGHPYGFHNFLFSLIDTPDKNAPFVMQQEHYGIVFSLVEKVYKPLSDLMMGEAVNIRMNTTNLTLSQIAALAARKNLTFEEVLAIPEDDKWEYSDGPNYVCSSFVIAVYKAAGLFGNLTINANEFTPGDIPVLDFFDDNYTRPRQCVEADPNLKYCQIMGKVRLDVKNYATIKPYDHMNERCPTVGPDFIRPEGC